MQGACVYTALTGGYEQLNSQPAARDSALPFICLTDDRTLSAKGWEMRYVPPLFPADPVRSQRALKILAHRYLPEFETSLYLDNTVLLQQPPEALFAAADMKHGMALCPHSSRTRLDEEFNVVVQQRLDDAARVAEQRNHYREMAPELLAGPVFWAGLLLRDHRHAGVRDAMELWYAHVLRYSRRDQLSFPMALHLSGLQPDLLKLDNYRSAFHAWPCSAGRLTERRVRPAPEDDAGKAAEFEARLVFMWQEKLAAEAELAELRAAHDAVLRSTSWRFLAPARALAHRLRRATR
jgi:hypothetical protein